MNKVFFFNAMLSVILVAFAPEIHWKWDKINHLNVQFPQTFLWGCVDSAFQTEGVVTSGGQQVENNWTRFEQKVNAQIRVGRGCDRWNRYEEDIERMASIGMRAYRFSVDWSKIEPVEGQFDEEALAHYSAMIDCMLARGITPFITLYHHICPQWFEDRGGFARSKNSTAFLNYATKVFNRFHNKVRYWIIFNEPVAYAMEGYFRKTYPPQKHNLRLTGKVIRNMLNTHVTVAQAFKKINSSVQVGIAHMMHPVDAYSTWNYFEKSVSKWFNHLMNTTTINFFKTGHFSWTPTWVSTYNELAPKSIDFIGVNYYTHTTLKQLGPLSMEARVRKTEPIVDFSENHERSKVMYPEGLYRSIQKAARLNKPIYITENGCASEDVALKDDYIKKHLYVVSRALKEGFDIRGYFFWTLTDCYSWNKGYNNRHGIFAVDFETMERSTQPRPHCAYLLETIKRFS